MPKRLSWFWITDINTEQNQTSAIMPNWCRILVNILNLKCTLWPRLFICRYTIYITCRFGILQQILLNYIWHYKLSNCVLDISVFVVCSKTLYVEFGLFTGISIQNGIKMVNKMTKSWITNIKPRLRNHISEIAFKL